MSRTHAIFTSLYAFLYYNLLLIIKSQSELFYHDDYIYHVTPLNKSSYDAFPFYNDNKVMGFFSNCYMMENVFHVVYSLNGDMNQNVNDLLVVFPC